MVQTQSQTHRTEHNTAPTQTTAEPTPRRGMQTARRSHRATHTHHTAQPKQTLQKSAANITNAPDRAHGTRGHRPDGRRSAPMYEQPPIDHKPPPTRTPDQTDHAPPHRTNQSIAAVTAQLQCQGWGRDRAKRGHKTSERVSPYAHDRTKSPPPNQTKPNRTATSTHRSMPPNHTHSFKRTTPDRQHMVSACVCASESPAKHNETQHAQEDRDAHRPIGCLALS
jgi:hypothetical protein